MNFQYSKRGLALTESFESCQLDAYLDSAGIPTIGWGHTAGVRLGDRWTQAQADAWLLEDVQTVVAAINRDCRLESLTQDEFDALVDFGFNVGIHALEHSTLWRKLMAGDLAGAAAEFPKWDMAAGKHLAGLLRRRDAEESLFLEGRPDGIDPRDADCK